MANPDYSPHYDCSYILDSRAYFNDPQYSFCLESLSQENSELNISLILWFSTIILKSDYIKRSYMSADIISMFVY